MIPHPKASMIGCVQNSLPVVAAPKMPPRVTEQMRRVMQLAALGVDPAQAMIDGIRAEAKASPKPATQPAVPRISKAEAASAANRKRDSAVIAAFWHKSRKVYVPMTHGDLSRKAKGVNVSEALSALCALGMVKIGKTEPASYELTQKALSDLANAAAPAKMPEPKPVQVAGWSFVSQRHLADAIGVSRKTVSTHYRRGDLEAWAAPLLAAEKSPSQGL